MLFFDHRVGCSLGASFDDLSAAAGKQFLYREQALPKSPLSWHHLNHILQFGNLQPGQVRLIGGQCLTDELFSYAHAGGERGYSRLVPSIVHKSLSSGGTLVIDQLDLVNPWADLVARVLAAIFRTRVQANLYASLVGAPGFGAHKDSHDVFVVQGAGVKHWIIGDSDQQSYLTMTAGDVLYLPEGATHEVSTDAIGSLHVTFAIPRVNAAEVLEWALKANASEQGLLSPVNASEPASVATSLSETQLRVTASDVDYFTENQVSVALPPAFFNLPYVGGHLTVDSDVLVTRTPTCALPVDSESEISVLSVLSAAQGTRLRDVVTRHNQPDTLAVIARLMEQGLVSVSLP